MKELIDKKKLICDLKGIYDVLAGAGDPFLASVIKRAIRCVEEQPIAMTVKTDNARALSDGV